MQELIQWPVLFVRGPNVGGSRRCLRSAMCFGDGGAVLYAYTRMASRGALCTRACKLDRTVTLATTISSLRSLRRTLRLREPLFGYIMMPPGSCMTLSSCTMLSISLLPEVYSRALLSASVEGASNCLLQYQTTRFARVHMGGPPSTVPSLLAEKLVSGCELCHSKTHSQRHGAFASTIGAASGCV